MAEEQSWAEEQRLRMEQKEAEERREKQEAFERSLQDRIGASADDGTMGEHRAREAKDAEEQAAKEDEARQQWEERQSRRRMQLAQDAGPTTRISSFLSLGLVTKSERWQWKEK
eukprot:g2801.t1